jgi:serine/threonine protein kinase
MRLKPLSNLRIKEDEDYELLSPPSLNLPEDKDEMDEEDSDQICTVFELKPFTPTNVLMNSSMSRRKKGADAVKMMDAVKKSGKIREMSEFVQIGSILGKGNSGVVCKALDKTEGRICALKTIHIEGSKGDDNRAQIMKEIDAFLSLNSENIVSFYGVIVDDDSVTLVLEYMNRGSLQDSLKFGPLAEQYIQRIAKMGFSGLRDMHKNNMVHRDIKPGNMLCNHKGEVKIADFGIVRELRAGGNEVANTFVGTQIYMSPERIAKDSYSFAADIWSMGLTLLTLANGEFPYKNMTNKGFIVLFQTLTEDPVPALDPSKASPEFIDFISHCLEKDPSKRWSAEELLNHPFLSNIDSSLQMKWPWDKVDVISEEAAIEDVAITLGETIFSTRPYSRAPEDVKLFQTIGSSLGLTAQESVSLIERFLPMHCWSQSAILASRRGSAQKMSSSRRSSVKPLRSPHVRNSSQDFMLGLVSSPTSAIFSDPHAISRKFSQ